MLFISLYILEDIWKNVEEDSVNIDTIIKNLIQYN
jgi:hypothetical protein